MITTTIYGTKINVRMGDLLKIRGIALPMRVVGLDAFGIVSLRRVQNGVEEGGQPFRNHIGDVAIEELRG